MGVIKFVSLIVALIHQFDTVIFPETEDKSNIFSRAATRFIEFFTGPGSDHPRFKVPTPDKMRCMCLEIHLVPFKDWMLHGEFPKGFEVCAAVERFVSCYQCCLTQYCHNGQYCDRWEVSKVKEVSLSLHN